MTKDQMLSIRLSEEEKALIEKEANTVQLPISEYARLKLTNKITLDEKESRSKFYNKKMMEMVTKIFCLTVKEAKKSLGTEQIDELQNKAEKLVKEWGYWYDGK